MMTYCSTLALILAVIVPLAAVGQEASEYRLLFEACAGKMKEIDTVDQMRQIVDSMIKYHSEHGESYPASMKRCMAEYDSIKDLESLLKVDEITDACHPNKVRAITDYYHQHLSGHTSQSYGGKKKRLVRKFVRRYALQVSLICRHNLFDNIAESNQQFTSDDFRNVFPWRQPIIADPGTNVTRLAEIRQVSEAAEQLFGSLVSIDMMIAMIRMQSANTNDDSTLTEMAHNIGDEKTATMRQTCRKMSSYYEGSIMSIVHLASISYDWNGYKLGHTDFSGDDQHHMVADWLSAAIVCESMMNFVDVPTEPIKYHEFTRNHLELNKQFEEKKFVKKYALSKTQIFANKWSVKLAKNVHNLIHSVGSKTGQNDRISKILKELSQRMLEANGDRLSKADGVELGKMFGCIIGIVFLILMFILIVNHGSFG